VYLASLCMFILISYRQEGIFYSENHASPVNFVNEEHLTCYNVLLFSLKRDEKKRALRYTGEGRYNGVR